MSKRTKQKPKKVHIDQEIVDHVAEILYICGQKFLVQNKNPTDAFSAYSTALLLKPDHPKCLHNIGVLSSQIGDFEQATKAFEEEMKVPQDPIKEADAAYAFVESARRCGRLLEAMEVLEKFREHNLYKYYALKAVLANEKGDLKEAYEYNEKALGENPNDLQCILNRALLNMTFGDWPEWFKDYEKFLSFGQHNTRMKEFSGRTPWDGQSSLEEKTLLIVSDQGFGDAFQFSRFFAEVKKRFKPKSLVFYCQRELEELCRTVDGLDRAIGFNLIENVHQHYDEFISLLGMMTILQITPETCGAERPYIKVDESTVLEWKEKISIACQNHIYPKVGLSWRGDFKHGNDHNRSMPLKELLKLIPLGASCFSLQLGNGRKELEDNEHSVIDLMDHVRDFTDTAALIMNMDLIVTVDTAIAHLAGSLGKPTIVMLPDPPEWRWLESSETTSWYPRTLLARQSAPRDWGSAIRKAKALMPKIITSVAA